MAADSPHKLRQMNWIALLALFVRYASACYGRNISEPYCWVTINGSLDTNSRCPSYLVMDWNTILSQINEETAYDVQVKIVLPSDQFNITKKKGAKTCVTKGSNNTDCDIQHFNVHACRTALGVCSHNVLDFANLITRTEASSANLENSSVTKIQHGVALENGNWTVIAHITFHTISPSNEDRQWDVCIGQYSIVNTVAKKPDVLKPALFTLFSIFVFAVIIFFVRQWLRKREHKKVELSSSLRRSLIREIIILAFDAGAGIVSRALQILAFQRIYQDQLAIEFGVVIPYAVFTVLALCATIMLLFYKFHLLKQAVNQLRGKRKIETQGKVVVQDEEVFMPRITDFDGIGQTVDRMDQLVNITAMKEKQRRQELPQWDLRDCDAKIHKLTRSIRKMQLVLVMAAIEGVPVITMNIYLMISLNEVVQHYSILASICASLIILGYHLAYLRFLKEAWFQRDKIMTRIDAINELKESPQKKSPLMDTRMLSPPLELCINEEIYQENENNKLKATPSRSPPREEQFRVPPGQPIPPLPLPRRTAKTRVEKPKVSPPRSPPREEQRTADHAPEIRPFSVVEPEIQHHSPAPALQTHYHYHHRIPSRNNLPPPPPPPLPPPPPTSHSFHVNK